MVNRETALKIAEGWNTGVDKWKLAAEHGFDGIRFTAVIDRLRKRYPDIKFMKRTSGPAWRRRRNV